MEIKIKKVIPQTEEIITINGCYPLYSLEKTRLVCNAHEYIKYAFESNDFADYLEDKHFKLKTQDWEFYLNVSFQDWGGIPSHLIGKNVRFGFSYSNVKNRLFIDEHWTKNLVTQDEFKHEFYNTIEAHNLDSDEIRQVLDYLNRD